MKRRLPPNWTSQLVAIILLFSLGVSFIPTGWLVQDLVDRSVRHSYSYYGTFNANLTDANPVASLDLGYCSDITIQEWTLTPLTPILLQIRAHDNSTRFLLPIINGTPDDTYGMTFARFEINLPHNDYILDAIRQTNNTFFHCWAIAYPFYFTARNITYIFVFWGIGLAFIILAIPLTVHFYFKTKKAFQNDYDSKF
jgi:hypothetical protein